MKRLLAYLFIVMGLGLMVNNFAFAGFIKGDCKNGQGTYRKSNGAKYVGEFKDGKRHGEGTTRYSDGRIDNGIWKKDRLVKRNNIIVTDWGIKYCENSHKRGVDKAECYASHSYIYKEPGCIEGDCRNGKATYIRQEGRKYVGKWKDGERHGQGISIFVNKAGGESKYVGEYKLGRRHGQGIYTYANGDKYVGGWKDGKYDGQGTWTYKVAGGGKYVGEWKDDLKHGQGTYTMENGTVGKGIWENDELVKPN